MTPISKYPLQVFFDGGCTICSSTAQKAQQADSAGYLRLIDISAPTFRPDPFGFSTHDARQYLHVIDATGKIYVGIDAVIEFRLACGAGRLERIFWRIGQCRCVHWLYAAAYTLLAKHRHRISRLCRL